MDHENIIKLVEIHEIKNSVILVMELVEGGELFNHLADLKCISMTTIHNIMKCLLNVLDYLDKKNIMHRDIKPENIVLVNGQFIEQNSLKVVDFGLATNCDDHPYIYT